MQEAGEQAARIRRADHCDDAADCVYVLEGAKLIPFEKIGDGIRYFVPLRSAHVTGHEAGPVDDEHFEEDDDALDIFNA